MSTFSNPLIEFSPQIEFARGPSTNEDEAPIGLFEEFQELDLAARLLEVTNEKKLHDVLHGLIGEACATAKGTLNPTGRHAIADTLSGVVHRVLPIVAAQNAAPSHSAVGGQLGSGLSSLAGQMLGLELEGLSPEDREFEAARQFIRFAGQTVKNALQSAAGSDPYAAANRAAAEAAEVYAPGLFSETHSDTCRGRWVAYHDRIILFDV